MRRLLFAALLALSAAILALAPVHAQQARVVAACGSLAPFGPDAVGGVAFPTMDTTGKLCLSGGGGGGSIVGGTTPVTGTCPAGQFLYNNSGVVGCSASSATIALPQAVTGGVSGGIPYFSAATTMSAGALLVNNAVMLGGGAAASPKTTTTGTGVVTALGVNTNVTGGIALVNATPTVGNCLKWAAAGIADAGACGGGGGITAGTTTTSGFTAGQAMYSDGSLTQAAGSYYSANLSSQRNGVTAQAERVYNTYSAGTADEWGTFDWTTTLNVLTIGAQKSGSGGNRTVALVSGVGELDVTNSGVTVATGAFNVNTSASFGTFGKSQFFSPVDGIWELYNNAGTSFTRMDLGGTTSSFPALAVNGTGLKAQLADASADTAFEASAYVAGGTQPTITASGGTCAVGTKVGGATAGTFQTSAVCASTNTIAFTGMPTAPNGWACDAADRSLPTAGPFDETASTTTGFTLTIRTTSTAATNVIQWKCMGY